MSTSFSELRSILSIFNYGEGLTSVKKLYFELKKLKKLRSIWFPTIDKPPVEDTPVLIIDQTESISVDVCERPLDVTYNAVRASTDTNPASVTYNAERYIPYRILWAKVIIRATYDYALWKDSPDSRLRKFALDAERWLFEPSDLDLSFENICFAFDFPVEKIRQKTRTLTKQDVKKLEFRERQGRSDFLSDNYGGDFR